ncbi:MAG TPA: hypothetical protein DEG92_07100 [Rikenellaceae bacterium]|nr:hypothetical protein [Rikenellaceae bacterium]
MEHVVVGSSGDLSNKQITPAIINNRLAGNGLYSLIDGLKGENIGSESIGRTANKIEDYRKRISLPAGADLFIDSGGYSFIKGLLAESNLDFAISLYQSFLQLKSETYDFIFSLDIPYSTKFQEFNTIKKVYKYNRISIEQSIRVLKADPKLVEKFFFIYHFKTDSHYKIWQDLGGELSIGNYIKYRAIGGMVSLKEMAGINIAPFIATTFQCLFDYQNSPFNGEDFRIHFLGISVAYDRFIIAFLERLIQRYLGPSVPVLLTYDTIKFKRAAMYRQDYICEFDGGTLHAHDPLNIPDSYYRHIYQGNEEIIYLTKQDLIRKASGKKHQNQENMAPLTISSELAIDQFFEHVIGANEMVEGMIGSRNLIHSKNIFKRKLPEVFGEYNDIFSRQTIKSMIESLTHVYKFHLWYRDLHDAKTLDQMSLEFINKDINFPFRLS